MSEQEKTSVMNLVKHFGGKCVCFDNGITILMDGNILRFGINEWVLVKHLMQQLIGRVN